MWYMKNLVNFQSVYHGPGTTLRVRNSALGAPYASLRFLTDSPTVSHQLIL